MYNAAIYIRLSKEDMTGTESNSVKNQRELIISFAKDSKDINICSEWVDDGYSGTNFERPAFKSMFDEINKGYINCIIVKDLSRFGRDYIGVGRFLERILPFLNIRFIAINDKYDSIKVSNDYNIILPFKNLINDCYSRDISIKIKTQLSVKMRKGDCISSFAVYGYRKMECNKNKLEIDIYAAGIISDIFKWTLSGMNCNIIAKRLNDLNILSPLEYKKYQGMKYNSGFKKNQNSLWYAVTVKNILKNRVYLGNMEQGKTYKLSYKTKKCIKRSEENWFKIENTHEAIISKNHFEAVQHLLLQDTRTSPNHENVYLFSGFIKCADCSQNMVRRPIMSKSHRYIYYYCSRNKNDKSLCKSHCINNSSIEHAVLQLISKYTNSFVYKYEVENLTRYMIVTLIEKIVVYSGQKIEIKLKGGLQI